MESSLKIQMDVRNNAQDLQNYMLDLSNWEEEMKKKEMQLNSEKPPVCNIPPRNKIKRSTPENGKSSSEKPKKISACDYDAWDKFDVDKACAEIDQDENDKSEEEEEKLVEEKNIENESKESAVNDKANSLIDEAFYEKELGNQFVKKEQWNDAIKCYTNAINLDSKNPIYYANRSFCFLKLGNFKSSEVDATVALQLDKNYVKAYQRRAYARLALGQLAEAKSDYEEVLKLEPKNTLANFEIKKINDRLSKESKITEAKPEKKTFDPKSIFKVENRKSKNIKTAETSTSKFAKSDNSSKSGGDQVKTNSINDVNKNQGVGLKTEKIINVERGDGDKCTSTTDKKSIESNIFKQLPDWCNIVHPVKVPPHKRSKAPLQRIPIKETDHDVDLDTPVNVEMSSPSYLEINKVEQINVNEKKDENTKVTCSSFDIPKTSIQFQNSWKILRKNPEEAYCYLKKIPVDVLPQIFNNSLESEFFTELLHFLANDELKKDPEIVYSYLLGFSNVKRFKSIILFMSPSDRACLKKCISGMSSFKSEEEIFELHKLYEL